MAKNKYGGLCAPRHDAAISPRDADFVWWFGIARTTRTATTLKVVSIDSEWQHYSTRTKVVSGLTFIFLEVPYIKYWGDGRLLPFMLCPAWYWYVYTAAVQHAVHIYTYSVQQNLKLGYLPIQRHCLSHFCTKLNLYL
jgi:hypothetical protein